MQAGSLVFAKYFQDLDVRRFDIRADYDENVPVPFTEGKPVPRKYRAFLKYFPNWATMPDFYRVSRSSGSTAVKNRKFAKVADILALLKTLLLTFKL